MSVKKERKHINLVGGSSVAATKKRLSKSSARTSASAKSGLGTKSASRHRPRSSR